MSFIKISENIILPSKVVSSESSLENIVINLPEEILIQLNGLDDGIIQTNPFNICVVNTLGDPVGSLTLGNLNSLLNLQI